MLNRCFFGLLVSITVVCTSVARADVSAWTNGGGFEHAVYQTQSFPNATADSGWNRQESVTGLLGGFSQRRRWRGAAWQQTVYEDTQTIPEAPSIVEEEAFFDQDVLDQIAPAAEGDIIDLGTLGGEFSEATSINSTSTTVVGHSETESGAVHAFAWDSSKREMRDLGTLGGDFSYAQDVNDQDQIVGFSETAEGQVRAFLFVDGSMQDLGTLGGNNSRATGINQTGQVVGLSQTEDQEDHAFLWDPETETMKDLGTLGGNFSYAYSISDAGVVAGHSQTEDGGVRAFTWDPEAETMTAVEALDSLVSFAFEINARGQVAGYSRVDGDQYRVYVWNTSTGELTNLGTFDAEFAKAYSLGAEGRISAYAAPAHGPNYAVRWNPDTGLLQDHGQFGHSFQVAWDINAEGAVVGAGRANCATHAIMWKPQRDGGAADSDIAYMVGAVGGGPTTDVAASYAPATGTQAPSTDYTVGRGRTGSYSGGGSRGAAIGGRSITVIPEPSTFMLCLIAFGLFAGQRWFRRRK
ncbi:MAG: PEP-CTERM sorting domain-containing protein [Planctomycetota bacterium]